MTSIENPEHQHSPVVQTALDLSRQVTDLIQQNYPTSFVLEGRHHVAAALFSIALSHREAALALAHLGAWTSVSALGRSIYEAYTRGYHAQYCLTDEQYERMVSNKASPKLETIISDVKNLGADHEAFANTKRLVWGSLSDYSHGGVLQLERWISSGSIEPNYSDEEVIDMLWFADMQGLQSRIQVARLAKADDSAFRQAAGNLIATAKARQAGSC